ncbi:MAG: hypothetical protein MJE66_13490 [Proteobacteria bacterium]|nr:hypothetical protein [Pseudomonadota bacterium]
MPHARTPFVLALAVALVGPAGPAQAEAEARAEADRLVENARAADLERAAQLYESLADANPSDFEARLGAALALNRLMTLRTNANLPTVAGTQDSDDHRALWRSLGSRALDHARAAHSLRPQSAEAAAQLANAYMYHASSLGVVRAILQGAGTEYRRHAERLIALDEAHDDGLGHGLLAGFYLVSPWPVRDLDRAERHFTRAAELSPRSARNQYGLGLYWARRGDPKRAQPHFERAAAGPCTRGSERFVCTWIATESRRVLGEIAPPAP